MRLSTFCHQHLVKCTSSVDAWKCWDSALGHERYLQAGNSKSTDPQQQNADDRKRVLGSTVQSMFRETWRPTCVVRSPSVFGDSFKINLDQFRCSQDVYYNNKVTYHQDLQNLSIFWLFLSLIWDIYRVPVYSEIWRYVKILMLTFHAYIDY